MSQAKFDELKSKLAHIKKVSLPQAIKETQRYGENGDFSENAEYQIAKGRLRGLNQAVIELEYQIGHALIIKAPTTTTTIQTGHTVTLELNEKEVQFKILGSTEANPAAGIISNNSPLGTALLGHMVDDKIELKTKDRTITYIVKAIL